MDPNTPTLPPSVSHASVDEFLTLWALKDPIYLDYEANGYAGNFCHVSAKHMAQVKGGSRIHGWGLWLFRDIIVGDFHSVWADEAGTLHDVTPPKVGARTLFVRDPALSIKAVGDIQLLYNNRTNLHEAPRLKDGHPTADDCFEMPNTNSHLVAYCKSLGLPDTSML